MQHCPAFFEARSLIGQLLVGEDAKLVGLACNHFFKACVAAAEFRSPVNWNQYFLEVVQNSYLDIAVNGGHFNVFDQDSGELRTQDCYQRYVELMAVLNKYYRLDVMAMIHHLNQQYKVVRITYVQHSQHYLLVDVGYLGLLTHE